MGAIASKTDEELRALARDRVEGRIFTDRDCPPELLASCFMVAALGGLTEIVRFTKEHPNSPERLGLVYEYLTEAGERGVNGYPMFMSIQVLNAADREKIAGYIDEYLALQRTFNPDGRPPL